MTAKKSGSISLKLLGSWGQLFDNIHRAACCLPSKPRFADSAAVPQSIHEPEDGYPDPQDDADLPQQGALLFLVGRELLPTRSGSNQLMALSDHELPVVSARRQTPFRQRADQTGLNPKNGQLGALAQPVLVRLHHSSGMDSLSYVVAKTDFSATTNITTVSIRQITAQQGQRETMATELLTSYSQFLFIPYHAECSEQLSPGIIRKMFELTGYD
jgi:hypothetical protein